MDRREFLKFCAYLGIATTPVVGAMTGLPGCRTTLSQRVLADEKPVGFKDKVLIIGAGAAGITAAYLLKQLGVDYLVLEASGRYGGRMKKAPDFVDYPIDLGAEWIHTHKRVLNELSGDPKASGLALTYAPMTGMYWDGKKLHEANRDAREWRGEYRFTDSTWYDFFNRYMAPALKGKTRLKAPVSVVDYRGDQIRVTEKSGTRHVVDQVIVTVPFKILKEGDISFRPALPKKRQRVLRGSDMPPGLKVFIEFREKFYPDIVGFMERLEYPDEHERMYYNVSLDRKSKRHVLGLFAVGGPAKFYTRFQSDETLIRYILKELDQMFDGKATKHYIKHMTQNWTKEPYIRGSYSMYRNEKGPAILGESLQDRVHFAGEAYSFENTWGYVHTASRAAYDVVEAMMENA